jgi:hypothetical protein
MNVDDDLPAIGEVVGLRDAGAVERCPSKQSRRFSESEASCGDGYLGGCPVPNRSVADPSSRRSADTSLRSHNEPALVEQILSDLKRRRCSSLDESRQRLALAVARAINTECEKLHSLPS